MQHRIETKHLDIGYGQKVVQHQLSLSTCEGELTALCGPNGAGKSTLLRTLCGLQPALGGEVIINGKQLQEMKDADRAKAMALVLTDKIMEDRLTVFDLVAMGRVPFLAWHGGLSKKDVEMTEESLRQVGLLHKRNDNISNISDGERQRVMVAKALAQETPIILLDEPTSHLDLPSRIEITLLLKELAHATNKSIILSTHELDLAIQSADHIWLMNSQGVRAAVPEDLMIEGEMQSTFQSENFRFDDIDGHCIMTHAANKGYLSIKVEGNNLKSNWLRRALMRTGFTISDSAPTAIVVEERDFLLPDGHKVMSVEEVLDWAKVSLRQ